MKKYLVLVLCLVLCASLLYCGKKKEEAPTTEEIATPGDIVEIASGDGRFTTLVTAIEAAGLAETLKGAGPYTVFAPTDSAFAKLPPGTVDALLQDTAKLKEILLYHVVPGSVMAVDVVKLPSAATMHGGNVTVTVTPEGSVLINDATVVVTDITAKNGVIHVIDKVLIPMEPAPEMK